jgi:hypothetical protein
MKGWKSSGEDGGWNRIGVGYVVEEKKMGVVHSCNPGTGKAGEIHGVEHRLIEEKLRKISKHGAEQDREIFETYQEINSSPGDFQAVE